MKTRTKNSCIGRFAIVAYAGHCYVANVLDEVADGSHRPKRVRVQNDVQLQGRVLVPSEYTFKGFADEQED